MKTSRRSDRGSKFRLAAGLVVALAGFTAFPLGSAVARTPATSSFGNLTLSATLASARGSTSSGSSTSIVGEAAEGERGVTELGTTPAQAPLQVEVGIKLRDPSALSAYIASVSSPASPDYRHYLAKGQFGPLFGPTGATVAAVRAALVRSGLKVGRLTDGMILPVTTTASGAERAFGVSMHSFRLASGKVVNANTTPVRLPSVVAPFVQAVVGLDNLVRPEPLGLEAATSPTRGAKASSGSAALAPGQPSACAAASGNWEAPDIAQAYDFGPLYQAGDYGQGQTVAVFEASGYSTSSVATYQACYGTSVPIQIEPTTATNGTFSSEADDDIEDIVGLAPKISRLLVYEVQSSFSATYAQIASDDLAQVISTSWSVTNCESTSGGVPALEEPVFAQMAAQGQSMFAASGDSGSEECNATASGPPFNDTLAVSDPASQPYVIGVGGTSLSALGNPPTTPPTETAWNSAIGDGNAFSGPTPGTTVPGAGTGGISTLWSMPAYQQGTGVLNSYSSSTPCAGATAPTHSFTVSSSGDCREVPDVSADAGDGYSFYTGSTAAWGGWLGTSIASPDWAAMAALINASTSTSECNTAPGAAHVGSVGFLNPVLYNLAASAPADFNDITAVGNDDMTQTNSGAYPTSAGYDMATGLGSPVAANLAQSLCPRTPITVQVSGTQSYSSAAPTFSQANNASGGVTVSGTLSCPSVNGGTTISSGMVVGSYTLDALQCTGLTDSDPLHDVIQYSGASGDFTVTKDGTKTKVTVSPGSEPYGQENAATFTVSVTTGNGEELPETDNVAVAVGATILCTVAVAPVSGGGSGTCQPASATAVFAGSLTVTADYAGDSDLAGSNSSTPFTVTLVLTSPPLANPSWEMPYSTAITATGAAPGPVTFSDTGSLPTGISLSSSGVVSGIATTKSKIGAAFSFTVTAHGPNGATGSQTYQITLQSPCGAGLTPYFVTASAKAGNFLGLFCTNGAGAGAYTQFSPTYAVEVKGAGSVSFSGSTTWFAAQGTNLAVLGEATVSFSSFTETAPAPQKTGTFTLM